MPIAVCQFSPAGPQAFSAPFLQTSIRCAVAAERGFGCCFLSLSMVHGTSFEPAGKAGSGRDCRYACASPLIRCRLSMSGKIRAIQAGCAGHRSWLERSAPGRRGAHYQGCLGACTQASLAASTGAWRACPPRAWTGMQRGRRGSRARRASGLIAACCAARRLSRAPLPRGGSGRRLARRPAGGPGPCSNPGAAGRRGGPGGWGWRAGRGRGRGGGAGGGGGEGATGG